MNVMVVYDSRYGHTEKVAQAIGAALRGSAVHVGDVAPEALCELDVLVVGSPTHGGQPTEGIHNLLEAAPSLEGVSVAAFDTRTDSIWNRILPFGYAAPRIARRLEASGGKLLVPPEGFVVLGIQGPLREGELERAAAWAQFA